VTTDVSSNSNNNDTSSTSLEHFKTNVNTTYTTYSHVPSHSSSEMADINDHHQRSSNFSKLLFSSPSATVTSNGPSVSYYFSAP
jgi:hypothetical protein